MTTESALEREEAIRREVWREAAEFVRDYFPAPKDPKMKGDLQMTMHRIGLGMSFFMFARSKGRDALQHLAEEFTCDN